MDQHCKNILQTAVSEKILWDYPLKSFTTFRIGGPAAAIVRVKDAAELQRVLQFIADYALPWRVIGKGSNLLVDDSGFQGVVLILTGGFADITWKGVENRILEAGAGCSNWIVTAFCIQHGLSGFEFCAGIPGTIGGTVTMNAGAWGASIGEILESVDVMTAEGMGRYTADILEFSYRKTSGLPEQGVITAARLHLKTDTREHVKKRCEDLLKKRKTAQPAGLPNGGSVFKNPEGDSAGRLIDSCGLKGLRIGNAQVSEKHANFIINRGGATASDVTALIARIQERVRVETGVQLELEVRFLC